MIALAVLAAVGWGASDFLGGVSRGRALVFSILVVSQLIGAVMILPALVAVGAPAWNEHLALAAVAGVCVTVELSVVYYALSIGAAFITAPVGALGAALAVAAGLLGGDTLTPVLGFGLLCAIVGGGLSASGNDEDRGHFSLGRSLIACLIAATAVAAMQITLHTAGTDSPYWAAELEHVTTAATAGLLLFLVSRHQRGITGSARDRIWPGRQQFPLLVLVALTGAGGDVAYAAASTGMLSNVSAIASLYPIPTIALASLLQHRRPQHLQILGIALALTGAAVLGAVS